MTKPIDLMREGKKEELWRMCCGFLNLSLEEFMTIQKRLLLEQIQLLKGCEMGRRMMGGAMPETIEEFREQVPLTIYSDYLPNLVEKRDQGLPVKPAIWAHTIGRAGEYDAKLVPFSARALAEFERVAGAIGLLSSCDDRGNYVAKEHMLTLSTLGSRYYGTGVIGYMIKQALGCDFLPVNANGHTLQDRIRDGFKEGLHSGLESCGGLSSILVYVGEMFKQGGIDYDARFLLSHPSASLRLARGLVRSKLAHRPMLPRDVWSFRAIVGGGTDSAVFHDAVEELWGRRPLEVYGGTEGGIYATQTWDHEGLTFIPNLNFFEFIPEREWYKWQLDRSYQPKTVLLDEVKEGELYEVVLTNFHGGIITRYRPGDMVRISSLRNHKLNIDIPQMVFEKRADDLIIIFGVGYLTESLIGKAIENAGIRHEGWVARKEVVDNKPTLNIYIEPARDYVAGERSMAAAVHDELERLDDVYHFNLYKYAYGNATKFLDLNPVEVTLLPQGAFSSYVAQRQAEGMDVSRITLPHVNPSDEMLSLLEAPKVVVEAVPSAEEERTAAR